MPYLEKCNAIRILFTDVDGVLTDGSLEYDENRVERKKFNVHDGMGIALWRDLGLPLGFITARSSRAVELRAEELKIDILRMNARDKRSAVLEILAELDMNPAEACFIGDDLYDLSAICTVGLGVAVANAAEEVRESADFVTSRIGGAGAVRETIETILKAQGRWQEAIARFE